jgi:hypothetical protein
MNRQLIRLKRYLERGPEKGCTPFDRYAYNTFSWQAKWYATNGKTEQDRTEGTRLCELACEMSRAMKAMEAQS